MRIRIRVLIFLNVMGCLQIFVTNPSVAADPQFTQFYAAPLYLNPAFAGAIPCWRAGANYRNQWFLGDKAYTTYMASVDYNLASSTRINGGIGGYIMYDNPGAGNYSTYEFAPVLSYQLKLSKELQLRFGVQPSYQLKYANQGSYTFGDQYTNVEPTGTGSADNSNIAPSISFFDLSSGLLLFSEKFWLGLAAHHLLRNPFLMDPKTNAVPMNLSLHGGVKIELNDEYESNITPAFNVKNQGGNFQTDLGFYYNRQQLVLGAWYRGIPYVTGNGFNTDALAFLIGLNISNSLKIGYSYDLPVSKMIYTFGTHEISAVFEFCMYKGKKQRPPRMVRQLPCPRF